MAEESDNDDKTEDASQRKLDRAIEQGDVVKSMEVSTFFLLGATLIMVAFMSGPAARNLATPFTVLLGQAEQFSLDGAMLKQLAWASAKVFAVTVLIPALVLALAVIAGNMIQHRLVFSAESLKPKLSKVSPIAGFKRLFGLDAWVNFIKGLTKLTAVAAAIGAVLWPLRDRLDTMVAADVVALMPIMQDLTVKMLIVVVIIMALIAGADYLWQRQRWLTRQKMTKQEVKDEYKETEGNPEVKAKIKQLRSQRSRKRMMSNVPKATVVITNPTHYAVALQYDEGMAAPLCVAKGVDQIALKIREVATAAEVPIVENPPLARALHAAIDIDEVIPEEHFRAVAEVIGFVMRMRKGKR